MATPRANPRIRDTIVAAVTEGRVGFRASYLQRQSKASQRDVIETLAAMVSSGELEVLYQLRCPNGETVKTFTDPEQLPLGETVRCERCEGEIHSFEVSDDDIYLSYRASGAFASKIHRERSGDAPPKDAGDGGPIDQLRAIPKDLWEFLGPFKLEYHDHRTTIIGGDSYHSNVQGPLDGGIGPGPRVKGGQSMTIEGGVGDGSRNMAYGGSVASTGDDANNSMAPSNPGSGVKRPKPTWFYSLLVVALLGIVALAALMAVSVVPIVVGGIAVSITFGMCALANYALA